MAFGFAGLHLFIGVFFYLIAIAVIGALVYFAVRLAVTHALKTHTRWLDQGKP
ncbi:hypothetical protein [Microbacterium suwonense]|uniref:Uncharacterized protein n=1 Tax=Microbacterium suwonense TaxID=683047 RepID=A0ABN6X2U6_9MICO|nr:hypothetical protein [Microbacterium suwonense]BDZ38844.1 hypothetical protein GCM10025863_14580 [Microbacterium suwonense]